MRLSFISVSLLLLAALTGRAQEVTDRDRDGLIGPVASMQCFTAKFTNDSGKWVEGQKQYTHSIGYNREGNLWEGRSRYPCFYYCYNDVKIETSYDGMGHKIDTLSFTGRHNKQPNGKIINTFDEKDRLIESTKVTNDGRVAYRSVYKRNEQGNPLEVAYYKSGTLTQRLTYEYEYDSRGNWTKQIETRWLYESGPPYSYPMAVNYRLVFYYSGER